MDSAKVGKRGAIVVPAKRRKRFGIEEGNIVIAEVPVERYTPQRKAEFLLSTATGEADYLKARRAVRKLGLNPDSIPPRRPK
jgi:AbrB family looped-hinge helix DNA binding protein